MKANWQKKNAVFWTTFFSIAPSSWCICIFFGLDCSIVTKEDSRCRHTCVYNVHKVSLLSTSLQAVYSKDTSIEMGQRHFLGTLPTGSTIFEHFCGKRQTWFWDLLNRLVYSWKKAEIFMQEFRDKRMMGHTFQRCDLKIKAKWKQIGKKKMQFSGLLFFLSVLEAGVFAVAAVV